MAHRISRAGEPPPDAMGPGERDREGEPKAGPPMRPPKEVSFPSKRRKAGGGCHWGTSLLTSWLKEASRRAIRCDDGPTFASHAVDRASDFCNTTPREGDVERCCRGGAGSDLAFTPTACDKRSMAGALSERILSADVVRGGTGGGSGSLLVTAGGVGSVLRSSANRLRLSK